MPAQVISDRQTHTLMTIVELLPKLSRHILVNLVDSKIGAVDKN